MQVYRHFDIGTDKPTKKQQRNVEHYMIDILEPDQVCNAGEFMQLALNKIENIPRDKNIIVTGGTFLYIKALLNGLLNNMESDPEIRDSLYRTLNDRGKHYLYKELKRIDPETASILHPNNYIRVIRAIEIYLITGKKFSELKNSHNFNQNRFRTLKVALFNDREKIKNNINNRVDMMLKKGLIEEVRKIRAMGYGSNIKPMQSIGYRQINSYLENEIDLERAVFLIKRDTRRYAKRQLTWLRKEKDLTWYNCELETKKIIEKGREFFY